MPDPVKVFAEGGTVLWQGDALRVLADLPSDFAGAVVTDPPYSSGGLHRSDRSRPVSEKYVQSGVESRGEFSGDGRDQRSWSYWMSLWLGEALRVVKPSGYVAIFSDWRQLPAATDALQAGGWVWRGIVPWDKGRGARAPNTGFFRHQCEYIVWGTKGVTKPRSGGPGPGFFRCAIRQSDKFHTTGKPTALMRDLLRYMPDPIVDPFAGSGTTLVAARQSGKAAVGVEIDPGWVRVAIDRIKSPVECKSSSTQFNLI